MANLNVLTPPPGSEESKLLDKVLERKDLSASRFGGQIELFKELNRYYYSLPRSRPGRTPDQPLAEEAEPDQIPPIAFTIIEQMLPVWMLQMFGSGSLGVDVLGRTEEDHKRAENIRMQLEYDFQMSKVFQRSIPVGKQLFKFGTGIFQVGYRYDAYELEETWTRIDTAGLREDGKIIEKKVTEKESRRVVRFDGPWLEPVSVTNAFPDPLYGEISEMRFFEKRRYTDRKRLKWEDEMHRKLTGQGLYKNLDKIPDMPRKTVEELMMGGGPEEVVAEALGWSSRRVRNYNRYAVGRGRGKEMDPDNYVVEVTEYWSKDEEKGGDKYAQVANGSTVISDMPIPWEDKDLPFGAVRCFPTEGEFWGYGLLHPIIRSLDGVTGWRNMMMQNAIYNALRTWGVSEEMDIGPNAQVFRPGDVTQIPFDPSGRALAVDLFQGRSLPREAYEYEDRMISDMQRAVGSSAMIEPTADTATEANYQRQGVVMKDRLIGAITELDYLTRVAQLFISRRQQFYDREMSVRTIGKDGAKFKQLSAQDIAGQFDYIASGSQLHPAKNVSRQQFLEAIGLAGSNPALMGIIDWYEIALETFKSFEAIRFPERLLNKPTEKVWEPSVENLVLNSGTELDVDPGEPHEKHLMEHQRGRLLAVQKGAGEEVVAAYDNHIEKHNRFFEATQGMAVPPQETNAPGAQMGPGMIPGMENAVPTEGSLNAGVGGFAGPAGAISE